MKPSALSVVLACTLCSAALRIPVQQKKESARRFGRRTFGKPFSKSVLAVSSGSSSDDDDIDLSTVDDLLYMANITLGGTEYVVQLDTGSSDVWIKGDSFPLNNVTSTTTQYNLTYGIGWAFGNISTAEAEFSGITIPKQAFLDTSSSTNPALSYGAQGVLGLGFTSLSNIDSAVNSSGGDWGRSLLYNAFLDNPDEKNYITFALQRSTQVSGDVEGVFTVGEIDSNYTDIEDASEISTWPVSSPSRWNVLLQAFMVGSNTYDVTTNVPDAPSNNAVVLLDSGTSYSYCTVDAAESIYGSIDGASFDSSSGLWTVPCDAEVDMALQFGSDVFPLHPLDIVVSSSADSSDLSSCIGAFIPSSVSIGGNQFDWILGDNVLRSVYTMYDFGDFDSDGNMGDPYVKLLSLTDPNDASAEFVAERGGTARTNITYSPVNVSSGGTSNVSVSSSTAEKLSKLVDYIPAVLAILGLNALALLLVSIVGISYMCRRSRRKSNKKERAALALNNRTPTPYPGSINDASGSQSGHQYERVAVNAPAGEIEPEDIPFTPPEPAFHGYENDSLAPLGARPRSNFGGIGIPRDYRVSAAGSDVTAFVPPSPGFKKDFDRPKSIA